jgi:peptidoglycan/LPS O-acetylase OafA/YrhL
MRSASQISVGGVSTGDLSNGYRPDIDGLRAVAVLAVLIFHAFPSLLPGGFVGVDIFFVISGYLITGIVLRDIAKQQFSIAHFYAQRVRRIFPALLLVMLFCLCVGYIALTSGEYKQLGRYVAGGAAFLNNFLFWRDAGYFDSDADTKLLLHLWSLAIEEQFYVVWPLALLVISKLGRRLLLPAVVALSLASLAWSLMLVGRDTTADFYSPLTRSWELLLGAGLALWAQQTAGLKFVNLQNLKIQNALSYVGVTLLLISLMFIDKDRAFPGAWALLPTLGAFCLIAAGQSASMNRWVLSSRPFVWIGLISYPLYLWHWPLLTFARIFEAQTPSALVRACLLLASVLLAYATYRWVERPIRLKMRSPRQIKAVLWMLSLLMLCMLLVGYGINRNDGLKFRHSDRLAADASTIVIGADRASLKRECGVPNSAQLGFEWCLSQPKTVAPRYAVVGDSKAEALFYGLAKESQQDEHVLLMGSMRLVDAMPSAHQPPANQARARAALERIKGDSNIEWVILSNTLVHMVQTNKQGLIASTASQSQLALWMQAYKDLLSELQTSGKRVMLVIDNPTLPDPNSCIEGDMTPFAWLNHLVYRRANSECKLPLSKHLQGTALYRSSFEQLAKSHPNVQVFDTVPLLCDAASNMCTYHEGRQFLYSYGNHISDYASEKIAKQIVLAIR